MGDCLGLHPLIADIASSAGEPDRHCIDPMP